MSITYRIVETTRYALLCDSRSEDGKSGGCALVGEYHDRSAAEEVKAAMEAMLEQAAIQRALAGEGRGDAG